MPQDTIVDALDSMRAVPGDFEIETFTVSLPIGELKPNDYDGAMHVDLGRVDNNVRKFLQKVCCGMQEANGFPTHMRQNVPSVVKVILTKLAEEYEKSQPQKP